MKNTIKLQFPAEWPLGLPKSKKENARFKTTLLEAIGHLRKEAKKLRLTEVSLSLNVKVDLYSGKITGSTQSLFRPAILEAVNDKGESITIYMDKYRITASNVEAIARYMELQRRVKESGVKLKRKIIQP